MSLRGLEYLDYFKRFLAEVLDVDMSSWKVEIGRGGKTSPQQLDGDSCGVCVIALAFCLAWCLQADALPKAFSHTDIPNIRQNLALMLLNVETSPVLSLSPEFTASQSPVSNETCCKLTGHHRFSETNFVCSPSGGID